jgi:hypothetical protein
MGLLNARWYLSRTEEAGIVIAGNHAENHADTAS